MGGGKKVVVEPHRHAGVFIARGKEDALGTRRHGWRKEGCGGATQARWGIHCTRERRCFGDAEAWVEERRLWWSHTGTLGYSLHEGKKMLWGRGGMGGGKKVVVEPHRHAGVFIARGKEDVLVTKNMAVGESVYGEKRIAVEDEAGKIEYRVWNPFRSKL